MLYPLFLTLHLFAALVFIGTVFFEVLFLESIRKQLPAKVMLLVEQGIGRRARTLMPWVLLVLFGGDRFLAASLETMRLAATGAGWGLADTGYLVRAQQEVAELNPCHEDNYYLANGLLTWGGADREGTEVLRRAMQCRFWDELPAFFYGFNQAFFNKDIAEASRALEMAAQRSAGNAAGFRKLAIMLQAESFADEKLALDYLAQQRAATSDPKLHGMLDKRVVRLQGLVALREAQRRAEAHPRTGIIR